jgi:hypothetical protein
MQYDKYRWTDLFWCLLFLTHCIGRMAVTAVSPIEVFGKDKGIISFAAES